MCSPSTGWTADILSETLVYHDHASKPSQPSTGPTLEDLRVAIQSKIDLTCTNAWPKEVPSLRARLGVAGKPDMMAQYLTGLAQNLNKLPLPEIKDNPGIGLPPEQDRLTGVNFDLRPRPAPPIFERPAALPSDDEEEDESMMDASAALDGDMSVDPDASAASLNGGAATNGKRARSESDDEPEDFEEV